MNKPRTFLGSSGKQEKLLQALTRGVHAGEDIRPAVPADAAALTELAHLAKRHWGYSDALIELWRDALSFTAETIRDDIVLVAEQAGVPVGVVGVSVSGRTAELEHLWVRPSHMGAGLGRRLFERALDAARAAGASELVIVSDPHAEGFYRRLGARRLGAEPSQPPGRMLPRLGLPLA